MMSKNGINPFSLFVAKDTTHKDKRVVIKIDILKLEDNPKRKEYESKRDNKSTRTINLKFEPETIEVPNTAIMIIRREYIKNIPDENLAPNKRIKIDADLLPKSP